MAEVKVSEIPDGGVSVAILEDPAALDLVVLGGRCVGPIVGEVFLVKADKAVLVTGRVTAPVAFECVRCLREFFTSLAIALSTQFVPPAPLPLGKHPMPPDEAENYYYRDDVLALDELVREEVLLAVPLNPQCRADCLGLCPQCSQDLNQGTCVCVPPPDHRWSRLRQQVKDESPKSGDRTAIPRRP